MLQRCVCPGVHFLALSDAARPLLSIGSRSLAESLRTEAEVGHKVGPNASCPMERQPRCRAVNGGVGQKVGIKSQGVRRTLYEAPPFTATPIALFIPACRRNPQRRPGVLRPQDSAPPCSVLQITRSLVTPTSHNVFDRNRPTLTHDQQHLTGFARQRWATFMNVRHGPQLAGPDSNQVGATFMNVARLGRLGIGQLRARFDRSWGGLDET